MLLTEEQLSCDLESMKNLSSKAAVRTAAEEVGFMCGKFDVLDVAGPWDGPWVNGPVCAFTSNRRWKAFVYVVAFLLNLH